MKYSIFFYIACAVAAITSTQGLAQSATGSDKELEFVSPDSNSVNVGVAGEDPADIARFLLVSGASNVQLSPKADKIAFSNGVSGEPQLWVMNAAGGQAQQISFGSGITFFAWKPDSDQLIYGKDNNGNEQESFFLVSADGANEKELMPAVEGGFREFGDFSADGTRFAYASTERNGLDFDIYLADSKSGESKRIYEGKFGFFVAAVSPDGKQIVIRESVGEDSDNLYLLDSQNGKRVTVSAPSPRANHSNGGIKFAQDGGSFYLASNAERNYSALLRYDLKEQKFITVFETDANVENIQLCGVNDKYLIWTTNHDGFDQAHGIVLASGKLLAKPKLPGGRYTLSCSNNSDLVAVLVNSWDTPGDIVAWKLRTGSLSTIFKSNYAGLDKARLIRPESIIIPARDGLQLQGLLYLPDAQSLEKGKLPPVVFEVHGGPTGQATPTYNGPIQYLLDRGIAVFQPNVRGSSGFTRRYTTLDDREKRRDSVRDLIDMLAFLKKDGRVDTDRAAVAGGSYGGYMVNAVLALYPDTFKVGVSRYGVADWVTALEVASPALKASDIIEYGDIRDEYWQEFYRNNSPINIADKISVPVLYSHGAMDPRIDIAETETMVRALRDNNINATYIRIPDEGHGWRKRSNQLFYYRRQAQFLEEHLVFQ